MQQNHQTLISRTSKNQKGTASIISALIIAIVLSLICIGFAKIMSRSLQESLNSNLSSAADYAAQSGVNDAIEYINSLHGIDNIPAGAKDNCNFLNTKIHYTLSTDTKYTCILIGPTSTELSYGKVDPYTSRVADVTGVTGSTTSLTFSWQGAGNNPNSILPPNDIKLLDETTWGNGHYVPVLRLTLYRVGSTMSDVSSSTYFLYPISNGTTTTITYGSADGSIQYVKCTSSSPCNVEVTGLDSVPAKQLYARLTPLYAEARINIQGKKTDGSPVVFNGQITIDVTARSSDATKRLQVKIDKASNEIPEYALRTTNLLCKRLTVSSTTVSRDLGSPTDCPAP